MDDLATAVNKIFAAVDATGSGVLNNEGLYLAAFCLSATVVWYVLVWLLDQNTTNLQVNTLSVFMFWGIATVVINSMNGNVRDIFVTASEEVIAKITGTGINPSDVIRTSLKTVNMIATGDRMNATKPDYCNAPAPTTTAKPPRYTNPRGAATVDISRNTKCKEATELGFTDVIANLPVILITFACQILAIIAVMLMALIYILILLFVKILFSVGLTFGSLLVGLSVLPFMRWLFDGWLKFMMTASLTAMIAAYITALEQKAILPRLKEMNQAGRAGETIADVLVQNEIYMIGMAILGFLGAFVLLQVPAIASGLLSGNAKASVVSFGKGAVGRTLMQGPGSAIRGGSKQFQQFTNALKGDGKK